MTSWHTGCSGRPMQRWILSAATALAAIAVAIVPVTLTGAQSAPTATAQVKDKDGNLLGTATFRQVAEGVMVEADLSNVPGGAGMRGVHLHQFGTCEGPTFASAGGHYNPTDKQH